MYPLLLESYLSRSAIVIGPLSSWRTMIWSLYRLMSVRLPGPEYLVTVLPYSEALEVYRVRTVPVAMVEVPVLMVYAPVEVEAVVEAVNTPSTARLMTEPAVEVVEPSSVKMVPETVIFPPPHTPPLMLHLVLFPELVELVAVIVAELPVALLSWTST